VSQGRDYSFIFNIFNIIFLIKNGGSFGGPAAILASRHKEITKAVVFCPVVDWNKLGKAEPLNKMEEFFKQAFGEGYRFSKNNWNKLKNGKFYSPTGKEKEIDGKKIFIIQTKDDKSIAYKYVARFSEKIDAKLWLLNSGGHIGYSHSVEPKFFSKVKKFYNS
jgi:hypothetical protein